jgi:hypothetical protein
MQQPEVVFVMTKTSPDVLVLTIDGVRYEYETNPYHIEKFKFIYRKSRLKALSYIKANSYKANKIEEPLYWLSFALSGKGSLGVIITRAQHGRAALQKTKDLKICPEHNSLEVYEVSDEEAASFPKDKLITTQELRDKEYQSHKGGSQCPFHKNCGN